MNIENRDDWVVVYQAPDEAAANIIAGLLQSEGIEAIPLSSATTWGGSAAIIDSTARMLEKHWGDVVVQKADVNRSLELINAYAPDEVDETPKPVPTSPGGSAFLVRTPLAFFAAVFGFIAYFSYTAQLLALAMTCLYGAGCGIFIGYSLSGSNKRVTPRYESAVLRSAEYSYAAAFGFMILLVAMALFSVLQSFIIGIGITGALVYSYSALRTIPQVPED